MNLSYTKLGILLLRVQGVILILHAIPGITMAVIAMLSVEDFGRSSSYILGTFLQPVIGLILYLAAVPIASRAVGFLDRRNERDC
jgi:hypothetical protein